MGGGFALLAAARGFDVAAPNYPALTSRVAADVLRGACPIVASYGGADWITRGAAAHLDATLDAVGVEHDIREYPGVRHSFLSRHDVGPQGVLVRLAGFGYDRDAAEDSWRRMLTATCAPPATTSPIRRMASTCLPLGSAEWQIPPLICPARKL